jgi:DNA mismatch repair protein MutL
MRRPSLGRVHLLDDQTVNRIAAGEVVERPASVVKELIENSLDARARSIRVQVVAGGRKLIRVGDDGEGMDRDDVLLALERHATSKLDDAADLRRLETLGFRGEALPSIAAVSRFVLRSAPDNGQGTEVEVRGGTILGVREVGMPRGTVVEVGSLFFNVPARRKFLRADATELSHVVRVVTRQALAHPAARFRLERDGRGLIEAAPAQDLAERITQIYGREAGARLLPFRIERHGVTVHGFIGRPADATTRRDGQQLFVNGRLVQDRVLTHGVKEGFGDTVPRGRFPAAYLFVECDPGLVDVNVHPQKTEVRFSRPAEVHDLVRDAVVSALGHSRAVPALRDLRPHGTTTTSERVTEAALRYLETHEAHPPASAHAGERTGWAVRDVPVDDGEDPHGCPRPFRSLPLAGQEPEETERKWVPLVQYRDSYIVAEDGEGLVIVDQHAAQERVLFERYRNEAERDGVEVQRLLFPKTIELPPHERVVLEEESDEFRRLGFILEPFGGETVRLDGIPAICSGLEPTGLLKEILGEARRTRSASTGVEGLRHRWVTTAACKAAIKIHHSLNHEEMQALLDDLSRAENPTTCPHGRPIIFRLTLDEIERAFRRR